MSKDTAIRTDIFYSRHFDFFLAGEGTGAANDFNDNEPACKHAGLWNWNI